MNKTNLIKVLCNFYTNKTYLCIKIGLLILAGYIPCKSVSQIIFHQDVFRGGVTAGGFSTGMGIGSGTVQLYIEPGSTIKKAYIFTFSTGLNTSESIIINGQNYTFNNSSKLVSFTHTNFYFSPINIHCIDFTNVLNISPTNSFQINIPNQNGLPFLGVFAPFIYIEYLNNSLPVVNTCVVLNKQNLIGSEVYNLSNLNPINISSPIGFSIYSDRANNENIWFNFNLLGTLNGNDNINNLWNFSGVKGHFYYQNNQLFGLDDDSPDSIMNGTDALANVSSFLNNNATNVHFLLEHNQYPSQQSNETSINLGYFLAYTSPCDTFSVTHTPDTTVCQGAQLPLFVTGGQTYEWTPQVGLSCYDCPNPIFTADSTMHYSIRIWNNDSCSKVLPLHIVVEEALPHFNFDISPTDCGDSTGSITITPALSGFSYINQTTQDTNSTGIFSGLESGFYPISIVNNSACSFDTVVFIPETLSVHAGFIASPNAGISPLPVAFTNTSSHANSYQWIYENQTSNQENINHIFQQDGIYPVMLIAYGNSILCADTAYDTIYVYLPIEVEIPNIFTPNSDQNNDQWGIKINVLAEADVQIFNRWGEVVLHKKEDITAPGFIPLWDGGEHVGGVYYYVLRLKTDFEKKEFKGNITLVR